MDDFLNQGAPQVRGHQTTEKKRKLSATKKHSSFAKRSEDMTGTDKAVLQKKNGSRLKNKGIASGPTECFQRGR